MNEAYIQAGCTVRKIGLSSDLELFFRCIGYFAAEKHRDHDFSLVLDQLYKRYVRLEKMTALQTELHIIADIFSHTGTREINRSSIPYGERDKTELDPTAKTLRILFGRFFNIFDLAIEAGRSFYQKYNMDKPIFISKGIFSPSFVIGRERPSDRLTQEKYDDLSGHPLWWS